MLDKDELRSFYDRMWSHYDRGLNRHERHRFGAVLALVETLERPNCAILDAGCGLGKLSERLLAYGDVTGVEWSARAVEDARGRVPEASFIAADLVRDDLSDLAGRFGLVTCLEVIEHVGRENRLTLVRNLKACLVLGGYLVLTTPNKVVHDRLPPASPPSIAQEPEAWTQPEDDRLTTEETIGVIQEAGLRVLRIRSATVLEATWESSPRLRRLRSFLPWDRLGRDALDRLLARSRLGLYNVVLARNEASFAT
jgi:2-polyprenyl-3-methyl-5-hydroxy-6-metoxy-1,4-benzoquinol methylase